jgi:hypothetical protein
MQTESLYSAEIERWVIVLSVRACDFVYHADLAREEPTKGVKCELRDEGQQYNSRFVRQRFFAPKCCNKKLYFPFFPGREKANEKELHLICVRCVVGQSKRNSAFRVSHLIP